MKTHGTLDKKFPRPTTARTRFTNPSFNLPGQRSQIQELDEETSRILKNSQSHIKKTDDSSVEEYIRDTNSLTEQREELNKMLTDENHHIEFLNKQKEKIDKISLIESNTNDLYNWDSLFSKSRPITAYTCTNMKYNYFQEESKIEKIENPGNKLSNNKKTPEKFCFPVALIDEKEDLINDFIKIHKNISVKRKKMEESLKLTKSHKKNTKSTPSLNITKNLNSSLNITNAKLLSPKKLSAARPQSVYAQRSDNDVFYLDKAFSEYYTQDESQFAEKFSLLHPKIRCQKKKLKETIEETKKSTIMYEQVRKYNKESEYSQNSQNLKVDNKELNLAGNSRNPIPLLKSIYKQIYPEYTEEPLKPNKNYWVSNKPLGDLESNIDYKHNVRNYKMKEFIREYHDRIKSARNPISDLQIYDSEDPDIKIFENQQGENELDLLDVPEVLEIPEELEIKHTKSDDSKPVYYTRPKTALIKHNQISVQNKKKSKTAKSNQVSKGTSISFNRSYKQLPQPEPYTVQKMKIDDQEKSQCESMVFISNQQMNQQLSNKTYNQFLRRNNKKLKPIPSQEKLNLQCKKTQGLFEDLVFVKNINREVMEEIKLNMQDFKKRPNTGNPGQTMRQPRPLSSFYQKAELSKKEKKIPATSSRNVNNVYFNQYIDIQFRRVDPSTKILL